MHAVRSLIVIETGTLGVTWNGEAVEKTLVSSRPAQRVVAGVASH